MSSNREYTDNHRYFVQYMIKNGSVSETEAQQFLRNLSFRATLDSLLKTINSKISSEQFKIEQLQCEVTKTKTLNFLNLQATSEIVPQLTYGPLELEYFNAVMKEIVDVECGDHFIAYPRALNIASSLTAAFTRDSASNLLQRLVVAGYFVKQQEKVHLGPRTILEFGPYLRAKTANCICGLCTELVFHKQSCAACQKPFHLTCIEKYHHRTGRSCPSCEKPWAREPDDTFSDSESS